MDRLADSHCHLLMACGHDDVVVLAARINRERRPYFYHVMSTNHHDLAPLDTLLAAVDGPYVVPYFGIHPWYSHLFATDKLSGTDEDVKHAHYTRVLHPAPLAALLAVLPVPIALDAHMAQIKRHIEVHGGIYGIGEIGLDKPFRIPTNGYYGNPDVANDSPSKLLACRVHLAHQRAVLDRQLQLAAEVARPVSLHCVKAHAMLHEAVSAYPAIPTVILHSYSGSVDHARQWVRSHGRRLYVSLSNWINGAKPETLAALVEVFDRTQLLIETDMPIDTYTGNDTNNNDTNNDTASKYDAQLIEILAQIALLTPLTRDQLWSNIETSVGITPRLQ